MSLLTLQEQRWREHLADCQACTDWFERQVGFRCIDGWAISEVFEQVLEREMPISAESEVSA